MTDQEGGIVRRLPGEPVLSEKQIGDSADPVAGASAAGTGAGENLAGVGMNTNLAPVLDVFRQAGNFDDEFGRSYSMDPNVCAECGAAMIATQQKLNVAATAKHFPGLGAATVDQNTDLGPVTLDVPLADLRSIDERPFWSAIAAGVRMVMTSWAVYPSLDPKLPSGLSPTIVEGELRRRLRFRGVTITDALRAGAIASLRYAQPGAALLAAQAGIERVLLLGARRQGAADAVRRDRRRPAAPHPGPRAVRDSAAPGPGAARQPGLTRPRGAEADGARSSTRRGSHQLVWAPIRCQTITMRFWCRGSPEGRGTWRASTQVALSHACRDQHCARRSPSSRCGGSPHGRPRPARSTGAGTSTGTGAAAEAAPASRRRAPASSAIRASAPAPCAPAPPKEPWAMSPPSARPRRASSRSPPGFADGSGTGVCRLGTTAGGVRRDNPVGCRRRLPRPRSRERASSIADPAGSTATMAAQRAAAEGTLSRAPPPRPGPPPVPPPMPTATPEAAPETPAQRLPTPAS